MTVKTNKLNCLCFSCKVCSKFLHGCLLCANHSWYLEAQTFYLTLFTLSSSFTGQHPSSVSLDTRAVVFYMILEYLSVKEGTTAFRVPPMKLPLCILVGRATKGAYVWSRACNSPCPTLTGSHVSLSKEDRSSPWAVPAEVSFLAPVVFFFFLVSQLLLAAQLCHLPRSRVFLRVPGRTCGMFPLCMQAGNVCKLFLQVLLLPVWGEKGLKQEFSVSTWFLFVLAKAVPYHKSPISNFVPSIWAFDRSER